MSIEQEINRNTMTIAELVKAVRELTEAIKGSTSTAVFHTTLTPGVPTVAFTASEIVDAVRQDATQKPFTQVAAEQVVEEPVAITPLPADENRYFHDEAHNAVYKIGPTESLNGLQSRAGVVEIAGQRYAELKAEYSALTERVISGNVSAAPAATPPTAPAAAVQPPKVESSEPPWSEPAAPASPAEEAPAPVAEEPTWEKTFAELKRLVQTPGRGQAQLIELLAEFGIVRPGTVLDLKVKAHGKYAEVVASAARRIKGDAA